MVPMRTPNDPSYAQQWAYFDAIGGINLPAAWNRTIGSAAITVAVLDTGLTAHPELERGQRAAARLNRVRSAFTQPVKVVVRIQVNIHAV